MHRVCLHCWSCDDVWHAFWGYWCCCDGVSTRVTFVWLWSWLPWCFLIAWNIGYFTTGSWQRTTRKSPAACLKINTNHYRWCLLGNMMNWILLLTIQGVPASSSCIALNAKETFSMYTIKVSKKFTTTDERSRSHTSASHFQTCSMYVCTFKIISALLFCLNDPFVSIATPVTQWTISCL